MKIKPFLCATCATLLLFSCKKEQLKSNQISTVNVSDYATNGVVTTQVSIAPPATPQTFVPNKPGGNRSTVVIDISSTKSTLIDNFYFVASYPQISVVGMYPLNGPEGHTGMIGDVKPGETTTMPMDVEYVNVTASNSPFVTSLRFTDMNYYILAAGTQQYNRLHIDSASGTTFSMCLVNNVAHLEFKEPPHYKQLSNGYVEIARMDLTGDTGFTVNAVPLNFYYDDNSGTGNFPDRIMVKCNGIQISNVYVNSNNKAVITIPKGFKHVAGKTETFRIYGRNFNLPGAGVFYTEMGDLQKFEWKDDLGGLITGALNATYYKEQTGFSRLNNF